MSLAQVAEEDGLATPILALRNVSKTFPGTRALKSVDLDIRAGEVHALVGANGSGKSTLIKVLSGYHDVDPGAEAAYDGVPFTLGQTDTDPQHRVRFVHQDLGMVNELNAMDNLAMTAGFERGPGGLIDWARQRQKTNQMLARLGVSLDVRRPLAEASPVERTIVAIARALIGWESGRGLLVLDEPTAVLPHTEVERLLDIVREVQRTGASVLYVSHRLDEVFDIADRVTVLRDGHKEGTYSVSSLDQQRLAELMVGAQVDANFRLERPVVAGEDIVLEVRGLSGTFLTDFSCEVRRGEILGIAGLAGSGAEEVPYLVSGSRAPSSPLAEVRIDGGPWTRLSGARRVKIPIVPADRACEAVIGPFSVRENLSLKVLDSVTKGSLLTRGRERVLVSDWVRKLQIKVGSSEDPITSLSGGNQQKVIIGRCLAAHPEVLVLAEPTAGVDVGTRQAIYTLIGDLAEQGLAVVVTSTDANDLIALCSRVVVLSHGHQVATLQGRDVTEHNLLTAMEAETVER
jgi:ribose transport system ATP-binding protein